ncbi:replication initiation protein [Alkalibacterium sp. 20]|uniref:replication initiation protein n=1 Tax=Alkalibacterium sp. 20 TaxID=1798803 RepID=UPI00090032F8|nr:replication initiation protein [Alkalibacterium sp. 20]OJF90999.1 plasmid replication initiation protein [Alkalibacterium sp. 20]
MANEVVKHHNDLNTIPMRKWTREEMDFFFVIIAKLRNDCTEEVVFNKYQLKGLARSSIKHNKRFSESIEGLITNVAKIHYIEKTTNRFRLMNLFSDFDATWTDDLSDMKLIVRVTDKFDYIINKLESEFTVYELTEFTQIRSTYAKTVYRLLKQWRTIGKVEFSLEQFKKLLDTPDYYGPSHIEKNIITPVMKELPPFFKNLKIKKVKADTRGNPVKSYIFTFTPEKTGKWIDGKYDKADEWFEGQLGDEEIEPVPMHDWLNDKK